MKRNAFTIIELLVSITIILLLIGAASVGIYNARRTSRDTRRLGDIFLYAHAIDAFALANNNTFPVSKTNNIIMCADKIDALDLSLFSSTANYAKLPTDPQPLIVPAPTNCPDAQYGYIYHTEYGHTGAPYSSIANAQNVTYSLEVGLENQKVFDEPQLRAPGELLDAAGAKLSIQYSDTLGGARYRFILNGSYCVSAILCYK